MAGPKNPSVFLYSAPAKFEDQSAIPPGTIVKYQYGIGVVTRTYTIIVDDVDFTADASTGKQFGPISKTLQPGQYFAAVRSVTKDGKTSDWSNEVAFTIEAKTPEPVPDFSAQ